MIVVTVIYSPPNTEDLRDVITAYEGGKTYGISEDKMSECVKFAFLRHEDRNEKFISAYSQGRSYMNSIEQANNNINKTMTTFTEKTGNDIYKPYFANISKYENEVNIDREILFAETALNVLRDMKKIKSDNAKKYNDDVSKCVDILNEIINPIIS